MRRLAAALFTLAGSFILAVPALADEWPSRPVRIVNTFAPGGAADMVWAAGCAALWPDAATAAATLDASVEAT